MICQSCQQRLANVHFTKIVNNNKVEMYLCEQCAAEKGHMGFENTFNVNDFFSGLIGFGSSPQYLATQRRSVTCEKCGMSFEEFQKTGKMGCSRCYELYGEQLKPLLKRLHGSLEHHGKVPPYIEKIEKPAKEIEALRQLLNDAIKKEQYEKAAELRDRIKSLEETSQA